MKRSRCFKESLYRSINNTQAVTNMLTMKDVGRGCKRQSLDTLLVCGTFFSNSAQGAGLIRILVPRAAQKTAGSFVNSAKRDDQKGLYDSGRVKDVWASGKHYPDSACSYSSSLRKLPPWTLRVSERILLSSDREPV